MGDEGSSIFLSLGEWNWLILAAVLFVLELLAPGVFLIWFGVAAAIVGIIAFATDLAWQGQVLLFVLLALVLVVLARTYLRERGLATENPLLNKRAQQLVGRTFELAVPIVNGRGKVRVGDSLWKVEGPDLPQGEKVKVVAAKGTRLVVEKAD